jgi:hypothetical protein
MPSFTCCQQQLQTKPGMRHCYGKVVGMGTSVKERIKSHRFIMMYKVMHGLVCIPESSYMVQTSDSRTRGANRLIQTILLPTYHTRMKPASDCGNKRHKTGGVQGQSTLRDGLATNSINATTRCI